MKNAIPEVFHVLNLGDNGVLCRGSSLGLQVCKPARDPDGLHSGGREVRDVSHGVSLGAEVQ